MTNDLDLPRVEGGYGTVLADPPWPYGQKLVGKKTRGGAEKHYDTLTLAEIRDFPVTGLLAEDAMLWLWTTNAHLHEAFHVLEAWGGTYKVTATWAKRRFGLGYWLRGKTEHLLLGVRGKPRSGYVGPHGATGSSWSTLLDDRAPDDALLLSGKTRTHSVKPKSSYEMIEALSPSPRLELFARTRRKGWESWGNEL